MKRRLRLVIDTNVLVSGIIKPKSLPANLVAYALREHNILQSPETLAELSAVLGRRKFDRWTNREVRAEALYSLGILCELVGDVPNVEVSRDPKDNMILAVAVGGKADLLVTGDSDLLVLGSYEGVAIITPRAFLDTY